MRNLVASLLLRLALVLAGLAGALSFWAGRLYARSEQHGDSFVPDAELPHDFVTPLMRETADSNVYLGLPDHVLQGAILYHLTGKSGARA